MLRDNTARPLPKRSARVRWLLCCCGWALTSILAIVVYQRVTRPDLRLWEGIETHGSPARHEVALTFDDGPHPLWAPLLADSLERYGARGTFCLVGVEAQRYPEITARLVRGGHQIISHSLTHPYPNLTALPESRVATEIVTSTKLLEQLTRQKIVDFRPPGGGVNDAMIAVLKAHHLRMAWWSENVGDWDSPTPAMIAHRLQYALRPGLVILMHQRENSVPALESFLAHRHGEDYTYTTFASVIRP